MHAQQPIGRSIIKSHGNSLTRDRFLVNSYVTKGVKVPYDTDDFQTDVIERSSTIPVLVDFWAEWCGPCKILGPVLERLAAQHDGEWALAKLDTDKHTAIAAQYGIRSIPNVKLFIDGQVADEFIGALPEPQVVQWLEKAIPSKYSNQLETAKQLMLENGATKARDLLQTVVEAEPSNDEARALLARTYFSTDPDEAVDIVGSIDMGSQQFDVADGIRTLVELFKYVDDPTGLPEDPVRDTYLKAIEATQSNSFESALDGFIEAIRKNRDYNDDGSRKACIAIFKVLGEEHPTTRKYRPIFSSALY